MAMEKRRETKQGECLLMVNFKKIQSFQQKVEQVVNCSVACEQFKFKINARKS